MSTSIEENRF